MWSMYIVFSVSSITCFSFKHHVFQPSRTGRPPFGPPFEPWLLAVDLFSGAPPRTRPLRALLKYHIF